MKLDCIKASDVGRESGWVIVNTLNGGIVAHSTLDDSGYAWMLAALSLARAITDMQRTIYSTCPQDFKGMQ